MVTGANSGLGFVTARELARGGAHVIGTARDRQKADRAAAEVRSAAPDANVEMRILDLADLTSVREFAAGLENLAVLVNNAGVMMPPRTITRDGQELQFATNHLGHFALTGLLLERLTQGREPRVVTVTSLEHRAGRIDFDDLTSERDYQPRSAYQRSKFANAVFGLELDRRLRAAGSPVKSVLAHPGYSATNLQTAGPTGPMKAFLRVGNVLFAQSAERGALPQIHAATARGVQSGEFYGPDGFNQLRGDPTPVKPVDRATDPELGRRLWQVSEELTGVSFPL